MIRTGTGVRKVGGKLEIGGSTANYVTWKYCLLLYGLYASLVHICYRISFFKISLLRCPNVLCCIDSNLKSNLYPTSMNLVFNFPYRYTFNRRYIIYSANLYYYYKVRKIILDFTLECYILRCFLSVLVNQILLPHTKFL